MENDNLHCPHCGADNTVHRHYVDDYNAYDYRRHIPKDVYITILSEESKHYTALKRYDKIYQQDFIKKKDDYQCTLCKQPFFAFFTPDYDGGFARTYIFNEKALDSLLNQWGYSKIIPKVNTPL